MTEYAVKPGGTPKWTYDATANDSDKSYTVPAGKVWELKHAHFETANTATVGNRLLEIYVTDGTNIVWTSGRPAAIPASNTGVVETFVGATFTTTNTQVFKLNGSGPSGAVLRVPLPPTFMLKSGYVLRLWDAAAIDAAADDTIASILYIEYDA